MSSTVQISSTEGTRWHPRGVVLPLADLRVIDLATVVAGPAAARYLADFGADVIKVERPGTGDSVRGMGWRDPDDDVTLWWKLLGRNKRCIALDLKDPVDLDVVLALCERADVVVENFRPGTLERLGLGPDVLLARNPRLVITRVTGFGQAGPYAGRPGSASSAAALWGVVAVTGAADGPPLLPPIALTDELTGLAAAFATLVAVHSGVGQVVDVNLLESMFQVMGPLISAFQLTGYLQPRLGSGIPYSVPRGTFRTRDGVWMAVSASSDSVATRVMALLGLGDDDRFETFGGRVAHRDEIDAAVAAWIGARTADEVAAAFEAAHAAVAPVLTMADIADDPHYAARGVVEEVDGVPMQGLLARLSATPGRLGWAGRELDADGDEVRAELDRG
jgi:crotonobetainyl-CoA:carnitine CoA-transferase CaiB-like acyl-CoA transferase